MLNNPVIEEDFQKYFDAGYRVIPVGLTDKGYGKRPLLSNWQNMPWDELGDPYDLISLWFQRYGNSITGIGIPLGARNNKLLACIDVDTNDKEIINRICKYFHSKVIKIGGKGISIFFLSDGHHQRDYYKFQCPGNLGIIEVFYGNRQIVLPPSFYKDEKLYKWHDDFATLLSIDYDDLPIFQTELIEGIGSLIGSPTVAVANQNLPKSKQFKDGMNRTIAINSLFGSIYRSNPSPDINDVASELLTYDAVHFPDNSFFLDPRKAFNKTNSRSANVIGYIHSMNSTIVNKIGEGIEFASPIETETITFNKLSPVTEAHFEKKGDELPVFNKNLIPECWRSMIDDICEGQGVPHQGVFMSMMTSLGACLQGNTVIKPLIEEKFFRRTNIATAMVATSGSKKSDVTNNSIYEIKKIDKILMSSNSKKDLAKIQDLEFKIEALTKEKKKGIDLDSINEEIFKLHDELESNPVKGTKFLYENAPIQKMILDAKRNQKTGLFLIKDEMKQIFADFKKKGNEDARTFYMQGFDGNQSFKYSTISRGDDFVEKHVLSMLTNVQPDVLSVYIKSLYSAYGENDGFLQRIILVPFGYPVVTRPKPVDFKKFTKQYEHFNRAFYSNDNEVSVAECDREFYIDMRHHIKMSAAKYNNDPVGAFLSKHEGLICVFAYYYEFLKSEEKPNIISAESIKKAMELLHYLGECAKHLFNIKDQQQDHDVMVQVAKMFSTRHFKSGTTQSEMFQSLRGLYKFPVTFYVALRELEIRGYVKLINNNKINSTVVHVNPEVYTL